MIIKWTYRTCFSLRSAAAVLSVMWRQVSCIVALRITVRLQQGYSNTKIYCKIFPPIQNHPECNANYSILLYKCGIVGFYSTVLLNLQRFLTVYRSTFWGYLIKSYCKGMYNVFNIDNNKTCFSSIRVISEDHVTLKTEVIILYITGIHYILKYSKRKWLS